MPDPLPIELIRECALQACRDIYGETEACPEPCKLCMEEAEYLLTDRRVYGTQ